MCTVQWGHTPVNSRWVPPSHDLRRLVTEPALNNHPRYILIQYIQVAWHSSPATYIRTYIRTYMVCSVDEWWTDSICSTHCYTAHTKPLTVPPAALNTLCSKLKSSPSEQTLWVPKQHQYIGIFLVQITVCTYVCTFYIKCLPLPHIRICTIVHKRTQAMDPLTNVADLCRVIQVSTATRSISHVLYTVTSIVVWMRHMNSLLLL